MTNILPALIGAFIGGLIAFSGTLYIKIREKREILFDKYLNRLKMANEEVFIRINELLHRSQANKMGVLAINCFEELAEKDALWYNEVGSFFTSTCYFVCWLFYCIEKIRREIPHFKIRGVKTIEFMNSLFDLQYAFLKDIGIFYNIQANMGREFEGEDGEVISYREFCEKLMDDKNRIWFKRLIQFMVDFKNGGRFEQFYEIKENSLKLGLLLERMTKNPGLLEARIARESFCNFKLPENHS